MIFLDVFKNNIVFMGCYAADGSANCSYIY